MTAAGVWNVHTALALLLLLCSLVALSGESYHGGTFIAMAGNGCVVLASDSRFSSSPSSQSLLIGTYPRKIYRIGRNTLIGSYGLDSDMTHLVEILQRQLLLLAEGDLEPATVSSLVSDLLYQLGYNCAPIIVGLAKDGSPYLCTMDGLGAQTCSDSFCISGTAEDGLFGICESFYRPNLRAEQLVSLVEKCVKVALQRDVLSGCTINVLTLTSEGIHAKTFDSADV